MITQDMTINEALRLFPQTISAFVDLGLDTCCGGAHRIADAAQKHGLDASTVVARANACIEADLDSSVRMCSL